MTYRCINAFTVAGGAVYAGGAAVADDHPILTTHRSHFARVAEIPAPGVETASAAPGEVRHVAKKAPAGVKAPHHSAEPKAEPTTKPEGKPDA